MSAAILAPATIAATYLGGPVFAALAAFVAVVMSFEWARMIEGEEMTPVFTTLAIASSAAIVSAAAGHYYWAYLACFVGGAGAALAARRRSGKIGWAAFGAVYILAPTVALLWLRESVENGRGLTLMLFAIVWSADSGAYFAGRLVGGPKLSPSLSPAKTWAGAIGGVVAGAVAGTISASYIFGQDSWTAFALMGGSLGLASILGDMSESAFKRTFGVKDMSRFIPGHGGVLDRLDGMIFATVAMTVVLYGHILAAALRGQG